MKTIANVRHPLIPLLLIAGVLTSSCTKRPAEVAGEVVVKGSNTFGEELAPRLIAAYRRQQPAVEISLESKGTPSGFEALLAGQCDIAAASRVASTEEKNAARTKGIVLEEHVIGYYGVAVIVHESNPLTQLTEKQVKDIFTGAVGNWKELGGPTMPIEVLIRDPASGTNAGFRELAMENAHYTPTAQAFRRYADIVDAVASRPAAVGYASMVIAQAKGVKALNVGKAAPNQLTVNEGWYPYSRMLLLYTDKGRESPAARDFIRFVQQSDGQKIMDELGFVRRFEKKLKSLTPD